LTKQYCANQADYEDIQYADASKWFGEDKPPLMARNPMSNLPYLVDGKPSATSSPSYQNPQCALPRQKCYFTCFPEALSRGFEGEEVISHSNSIYIHLAERLGLAPTLASMKMWDNQVN